MGIETVLTLWRAEGRSLNDALEVLDAMVLSLTPAQREAFWASARRVMGVAPPASDPTDQTDVLARLAELTSALAGDHNMVDLLGRVTSGAVALSGAERGLVLLVDDDGSLNQATSAVARRALGEQTVAFSETIAKSVLIDGRALITVDARQDTRIADQRSVHNLGLKSVACFPINCRDRTVGVLYLEHRGSTGTFSNVDEQVLSAFAAQAAIAIDSARFINEVSAQKHALERSNEALEMSNSTLQGSLRTQQRELEAAKRALAEVATDGAARWGLVGQSAAMRRVHQILERVVATEVPVVVTGESGTGKELVARALHRHGPRASGPFVSIGCGAIAEGVLEGELFGYEPGAFTGATRKKTGVFVQAHRGTLFLDEIDHMPMKMQVDLLRVVQERRVTPIGAATDLPVDVRLICASQTPLNELIEQGRFRQDLYYRLSVMEVLLPPLRKRQQDIAPLCTHLLHKIAQEHNIEPKTLTKAALQELHKHSLPGNVRQLEHMLLSAMVMTSSGTIDADDLGLGQQTASRPPVTQSSFKQEERDRIVEALHAHGWNKTKAARALGLPRRTLYRRLKEYGLTD